MFAKRGFFISLKPRLTLCTEKHKDENSTVNILISLYLEVSMMSGWGYCNSKET